jgi:hypothetical protein
MESRLYQGQVRHRRTAHARHEFRYGLFLLYLDLAELPRLFDGRWFWSLERPNWASFRRGDHLRRPGPLDQAVRDTVADQLGFRPTGPIRLLTHLRYLGYCFNPISIYYCFDIDNRLEAIVTEVHNTPWGEEYVRALDARRGPDNDGWYRYRLDKEFHVSPFMPMSVDYTWLFSEPGQELAVRMENRLDGLLAFEAGLALTARALNRASLAGALLRWPWMTARVISAIYWQALLLKLKGVPFQPHPDQPMVQKGHHHP